MKITDTMLRTRANSGFIPGSVHYNRRKYDNHFEVVARLYDSEVNDLEVNIGGEVVLDVHKRRDDALASVRFFRGHAE